MNHSPAIWYTYSRSGASLNVLQAVPTFGPVHGALQVRWKVTTRSITAATLMSDYFTYARPCSMSIHGSSSKQLTMGINTPYSYIVQ